MKKKFLALLMTGVMAAFALTACGDDAAAEVTDVEETADDSAAAEGDLTFADLQDEYATLTDLYNQVEELYMNDQIEQDDDIESLLTDAKALIDEMGELTEDDFTSQQDYKDMEDSMVTMAEALGNIVDGMTVTDDSAAAEGELTFADLQDAYADLTDIYNTVEDYYMSDDVEQDDDVEALLTEAQDLIAQMGEVSEDELDQDGINDMYSAMVSVAESLSAIAQAM